MYQIQDQSLRPLATAHLAQTMSLLVLSNQELREEIQHEIASNPALEIVDQTVCPTCHRILRTAGPCPVCSAARSDDEPIVFLSPRESFKPGSRASADDFMADQELAAPEDLTMTVLTQLAADIKPEDRKLAVYILSSLDDNGFLQDPPVMLARLTHSTLEQVSRILSLISHADPAGLATSGPRGALLVQLELILQNDPGNDSAANAVRIISDLFNELGKKDYETIARKLKISIQKARAAVQFIHDNLTPYPASSYWGSGRQSGEADPNIYHTPDIMIGHNPMDREGPLVVEIFAPIFGWLRVNPLFKKVMVNDDDEKSEAWSNHLDRANLFVKCMQQRNNTMRQLMESLVSKQRQFIIFGDRELTPMTRASIAEEIGVHESTISRAVSSKSVALPDGRIIPLSRFFDRSLSVRDRIKDIIRKESKPFTDEQIVELLRKQNIEVARRTVAKYRSIEGILPARLREKKAHAAARV
jgi:RNA polymerase sigma-54 factor